jgi:hypothetical protein
VKTALLIADAYLVGLAVVVLVVVYPSFRLVGQDEWSTFHQRHSTAIAIAVGPAWFVQGVLSALWIVSGSQRPLALLHGVFAAVGVVTTVFGAIPQHNTLVRAQESKAQRTLERWHAARTLAWIAALVVVVFLNH